MQPKSDQVIYTVFPTGFFSRLDSSNNFLFKPSQTLNVGCTYTGQRGLGAPVTAARAQRRWMLMASWRTAGPDGRSRIIHCLCSSNTTHGDHN